MLRYDATPFGATVNELVPLVPPKVRNSWCNGFGYIQWVHEYRTYFSGWCVRCCKDAISLGLLCGAGNGEGLWLMMAKKFGMWHH